MKYLTLLFLLAATPAHAGDLMCGIAYGSETPFHATWGRFGSSAKKYDSSLVAYVDRDLVPVYQNACKGKPSISDLDSSMHKINEACRDSCGKHAPFWAKQNQKDAKELAQSCYDLCWETTHRQMDFLDGMRRAEKICAAGKARASNAGNNSGNSGNEHGNTDAE